MSGLVGETTQDASAVKQVYLQYYLHCQKCSEPEALIMVLNKAKIQESTGPQKRNKEHEFEQQGAAFSDSVVTLMH